MAIGRSIIYSRGTTITRRTSRDIWSIFGEIYSRRGDLKQRELIAISSLATMGGCDRSWTRVNGAFNVGLTEAELVEAVMTLIPFIGFPRALVATRIVKDVADFRRESAGPSPTCMSENG